MTLADEVIETAMSPSGHERRFRDVRGIASGSHRVWVGKGASPDQLVLGIRIHMVLVPEKTLAVLLRPRGCSGNRYHRAYTHLYVPRTPSALIT
jgi:hypothetical protein